MISRVIEKPTRHVVLTRKVSISGFINCLLFHTLLVMSGKKPVAIPKKKFKNVPVKRVTAKSVDPVVTSDTESEKDDEVSVKTTSM